MFDWVPNTPLLTFYSKCFILLEFTKKENITRIFTLQEHWSQVRVVCCGTTTLCGRFLVKQILHGFLQIDRYCQLNASLVLAFFLFVFCFKLLYLELGFILAVAQGSFIQNAGKFYKKLTFLTRYQRTCAYQGVRNVSFPEKFCVINDPFEILL